MLSLFYVPNLQPMGAHQAAIHTVTCTTHCEWWKRIRVISTRYISWCRHSHFRMFTGLSGFVLCRRKVPYVYVELVIFLLIGHGQSPHKTRAALGKIGLRGGWVKGEVTYQKYLPKPHYKLISTSTLSAFELAFAKQQEIGPRRRDCASIPAMTTTPTVSFPLSLDWRGGCCRWDCGGGEWGRAFQGLVLGGGELMYGMNEYWWIDGMSV